VQVAKAGLFAAPFQQPVSATSELVGEQARDQINGRHGFGLGLPQAGFQHSGHAAES